MTDKRFHSKALMNRQREMRLVRVFVQRINASEWIWLVEVKPKKSLPLQPRFCSENSPNTIENFKVRMSVASKITRKITDKYYWVDYNMGSASSIASEINGHRHKSAQKNAITKHLGDSQQASAHAKLCHRAKGVRDCMKRRANQYVAGYSQARSQWLYHRTWGNMAVEELIKHFEEEASFWWKFYSSATGAIPIGPRKAEEFVYQISLDTTPKTLAATMRNLWANGMYL